MRLLWSPDSGLHTRWVMNHPDGSVAAILVKHFGLSRQNTLALVSVNAKYSQFLNHDPGATEYVNSLEKWLLETFSQHSILRIDESVRLQWQKQAGATWWQVSRPIEEFLEWSRNQTADVRFHYAMVAISTDLDVPKLLQ